MSYLDQVEIARSVATRAHEGQLDKVGAPYIEHPAMVAWFVQALPGFTAVDQQTQSDALSAAWLHDVIEDTDETAESLRAAGISERAVAAVAALTRTEEVTADDYYAAINALPVALLVKTADLASNLAPGRVARLDEHTRVRLAAKYTHALEVGASTAPSSRRCTRTGPGSDLRRSARRCGRTTDRPAHALHQVGRY